VLDAKVIVIEPSDARANTLTAVMRFLDVEPLHVHDLAELGEYQRHSMNDWLAVIVGEDTVAAQGAELVARLRSIAQPPPLIYLSADRLPKIAETSGDLAWFHLELPVKQRRLSAVLEQAQNVRTGHPAEPGAHRFRPSGTSRAMRAVHRLIEQIAPFDTSLLIVGEPGTGKELVARHIHELSGRAGHPFVPVNCGAIPADHLESELFGRETAAFSGELPTRPGRLEAAEGGTVYLHEIGDMSLPMQVKLLRVLQERSFERVGSNRTIGCNVRIIAATHRDPDEMIASGRFRADLFYRLNVFPVPLPPLRERLEDLPVLIEHLLQRQGQISGRHIRLCKDAMTCLARGRWPGNVRELSHLLASLDSPLPEHSITAADLPEPYRGGAIAEFAHAAEDSGAPTPALEEFARAATAKLPRGGIELQDDLSAIEIDMIRKALEAADGTVAGAARLLNIRRTTLVEKLRKYRLSA
jgi:sigma-54 specific flagellar transcriptional regulator A